MKGDAREQAARLITGTDSSQRLERIAHLQHLAENPDQSEEVRQRARAELFRELIVLGVDEDALDRIGSLFMEGQSTAAEAFEVLVETLRASGMDQETLEKRVTAILPGAGSAARLIFLSAARTLLTERYGFPKG